MMKTIKLKLLKSTAKDLIDDGENIEYTRGICELISNFDGKESISTGERAQEICNEFGININLYPPFKDKWVCTDPDNDQWRLDEGQDIWWDTQFRFKQGSEHLNIDLKDYPLKEINSIISSFGYIGNGAVYYIDGEETEIDNSIIAECIFESEIGVI